MIRESSRARGMSRIQNFIDGAIDNDLVYVTAAATFSLRFGNHQFFDGSHGSDKPLLVRLGQFIYN
jgi:hypothetical protein